MYRTHTCGQLSLQHLDQTITLAGWVNRIRNLGGLTFIDLRDRYGITQIAIDPANTKFSVQNGSLSDIKAEFVLQITGKVVARPSNMVNPEMKTGEIEIQPSDLLVLSTCAELPFTIDNENPVGEELRLEHRYLDLRRKSLRDTMLIRSQLYTQTIQFFDDKDFVYFETPCFTKNTPEGSREFIVPARFDQGKFFVLPQSPQQYKQMLMVAGYDRYIQLSRCFRDEDPRGDRQPEFTQVDFEMSFVQQDDVLEMIQDYFLEMTKSFPTKQVKNLTFPRYTWKWCMDNYGSDKPDLRTEDMKFTDLTEWSKVVDFSLFSGVQTVKCLVADREFGRSEIEKTLEPVIKENGGKGLLYLIFGSDGELKGPLAKYLTTESKNQFLDLTGIQSGQTAFFQFGDWSSTVSLLGALRIKLLRELQLLIDKQDMLDFAFVIDAPMFEIGSDGSLGSTHHPFTKPKDQYIPYLIELADKMRDGYALSADDIQQLTSMESDSYDIVADGYEIGGGSIRIHDQRLQHAIFTILGLTETEIEFRFGHILKCFTFGVPPHGGCAFGFDRIIMIYCNSENIREVIAFPKNQKYRDPMFGSPSEVDPQMLKELGLRVE
ncbi:aspartate--tRNA ligase [candidate division SR1 bacterium]|nr:aspartate--tRNA ligase [candidate division SR1 bacterium]